MRHYIIWGTVILFAFVVVKFTTIGPIIWTFSAENGWGIHSGDLIILVPFLLAVIYSTRCLIQHLKK